MLIPGWKLGPVSCSKSGLSTSWTMEWGHLGWVKRAFEEYNTRGLDYLLDNDGKTAIVSLAIGDVAIHSETPKLMVYELREEWNDIFQAIKQQVVLAEATETRRPSKPKIINGQEVWIDRTYPRLNFSFSSDLPMEEWLDMFKRFPSLEIDTLNYTPENNIWTYEGHIYEPTP